MKRFIYTSKVIIVTNFSLLLLAGCSQHQSNSKLKLDDKTVKKLKPNIIFKAVNQFPDIKIKNNINEKSWSFKGHYPIIKRHYPINKEMIDFSFKLNNYGTEEYTTINRKIQGQIDYDFKTKNFSFDSNRWKLNGVPNYWNASLGVGSSITGDGNDFTIMVSYSYLDQLSKSLWDNNDKDHLFLHCSWKNIDQFKELNVDALSRWFHNTYQKMEWGWVDPGHMTVIHLKKINGEYQTVWTNLDSKKGSNSLAMTFWGSLSSLIIKINGKMHWWVNKNLLVNIYDTLRYFQKAKIFLDKNNAWWKQVFFNPKSGSLNLQCTSQYNLKQTQIFNIIVGMDQAELYKQINKNYFAYDLVFEGKKSNWTWQNTSELLLNHNNN